MTDQELFDLYSEIVVAMEAAGVVFNRYTYHDLIESICNGQYYLARDEAGAIVTFCNYWKVDNQELPLSVRPDKVTCGNLVFVVDCFNLAGRSGMKHMIQFLREAVPNAKGAAWYHKLIDISNFRFFPRQRGVAA